MLFPVLLYFYFEFPLYSLLLNIAVIPMMCVGSGTWTYRQLVFANLSADRYGFGKSVWNIFGTV